jgi:L-seryl-tRNA(Ser) seleniumtransferase
VTTYRPSNALTDTLETKARRDEKLRRLPSVQRLLELPFVQEIARSASRPLLVQALRTAIAETRQSLIVGAAVAPGHEEIAARAVALLSASERPGLRRVINATGIVLHTNLGRAPLALEAVAAVVEAAGYTNLEYDLDTGERGLRTANVEGLLREITGAAAALVVNNNAAAVLLAVTALAAGGEVVVSRGELVEIGGGFRIPDVIRQGGARLKEVGTTNRTRLQDYREAISADARVLLKVHQSNYRIEGFTAAVSVAELARVARERGLVLIEDLGSGTLLDPAALGRAHEPSVQAAVSAGADIVCFSGDKLLGGPQAGILVGTETAMAPLRQHPLLRALRCDKLCLAALEATLRVSRDPGALPGRIPVMRMLAQTEAELQLRAEHLLALLDGMGEIRSDFTYAGGGALAARPMPTRLVVPEARGMPAQDLGRRLRQHQPAIVGRITDDRLALDVFTVGDDELEQVAQAVRAHLV